MTLKEADALARTSETVYLHGDVPYRRIIQIGYIYNEYGRPRPYVLLEDNNRHSQTYADPKNVTKERADETD